MSRIFPDPMVGKVQAGFAKVYRALKLVPGEGVTVWVSLPLVRGERRPDFLVVAGDRSAVLVGVSEIVEREWMEATGQSLFGGGGEKEPGEEEVEGIRRFWETVQTKGGEVEAGMVRGVVFFPHISEAEVRSFYPKGQRGGVFLFGRERLEEKRMEEWLTGNDAGEIPSGVLAFLRSDFTPESVVPTSFAAARRGKGRGGGEPIFLDYDQEEWTKRKLWFAGGEGEVLAETGGEVALVTGVAGSGKSLVLLFRACTQARLAVGSKSLVLTHNRALKNELQERFGELGNPPNVKWMTFYAWLLEVSKGWAKVGRMADYEERAKLVREGAREVYGKLKDEQVEFLSEEFDWMQDRGVSDEDAYLEVERVGRGVKLVGGERKKVFQAYVGYRKCLEREGREDWSGLALWVWRRVESGKIRLPQYDFIYIDEAQFFAPVWFWVVKKALREEGKIFLAADPTQGFLKRRQSWVVSGFDLRGRATRLRKSYRNTRKILEFAAKFYRSRVEEGEEGEEVNLPEEEEMERAEEGECPSLIVLPGVVDEIRRGVQEAVGYCQRGGQAGDFLFLVAGRISLSRVIDVFAESGLRGRVRDAREEGEKNCVRVCGLDAATGLEAPVVFLLGMASLLEEEGNWGRKEEQRRELVRDNTKRLYMGFTRAACRLVMTWSGVSKVPTWLSENVKIFQEREWM